MKEVSVVWQARYHCLPHHRLKPQALRTTEHHHHLCPKAPENCRSPEHMSVRYTAAPHDTCTCTHGMLQCLTSLHCIISWLLLVLLACAGHPANRDLLHIKTNINMAAQRTILLDCQVSSYFSL